MFKYLLIGLVLLCLEVLLVAILAADGQVNRAIEHERLLAAAWLGETVEATVAARARTWFNRRFVHNGVVAASYGYLIPDEAMKQRSGALGHVGEHDVFPYMQGRLNVLWDTLRQVTYRFAMLTVWVPYLLPLAGAAILDGLMRRRVKMAEFGNASPAVHRYSLYALLLLIYFSMLALLIPIPLTPLLAPALLILFIIFLNLLLANTPQRV